MEWEMVVDGVREHSKAIVEEEDEEEDDDGQGTKLDTRTYLQTVIRVSSDMDVERVLQFFESSSSKPKFTWCTSLAAFPHISACAR